MGATHLAWGVTEDYAEAAKPVRTAAEQGDASGQFSLGLCYKNGDGVRQDYAEAAKWFHKAAEQGQICAQALWPRAMHLAWASPRTVLKLPSGIAKQRNREA